MKADDLNSAEVNLCVARALGHKTMYIAAKDVPAGVMPGWYMLQTEVAGEQILEPIPNYCGTWVEAGPIIEKHRISLTAPHPQYQVWSAGVGVVACFAMDPKEAAMRCFILNKLGPNIDPEKL